MAISLGGPGQQRESEAEMMVYRIEGKPTPTCLGEHSGDYQGTKCGDCRFGALCVMVALAKNTGEWKDGKEDG